MQKTFVMIKPNGVQNGLIGRILGRYEGSSLSVCAIKILQPTVDQVEGFYAEHQEREFFGPLVEFMSSGPTIMAVLGGNEAVAAARAINGSTNPEDAAPGTIRYDFAPNTRMNVVHSSDSEESAKREMLHWFDESEIVDYKISKTIAM